VRLCFSHIFILPSSAKIATIRLSIVPKPVEDVIMKGKIAKILLPILGGIVLLQSQSGCAVDNQTIARLPLFSAKSDVIPGFDPPHVRLKQIETKGKEGAKASEAEREILVAQLMHEYMTSPDSNMRRATVDALAKIPHPERDRFLRDILRDENPFVRISALEALGAAYSGSLSDLTSLLIEQAKIDVDGDVRITAVRILGDVSPKAPRNNARDNAHDARLRESITVELGGLLDDRVLAVRYEAMRSLKKITRKDYGYDMSRWSHYVRYVRGEVPDLPSGRTFSEKLPTISLPMFR